MSRHRWKEVYYKAGNTLLLNKDQCMFFSSLARRNGTGTKSDPKLSVVNQNNSGSSVGNIIASGYNRTWFGYVESDIIGQGQYNTFLNHTNNVPGNVTPGCIAHVNLVRLTTNNDVPGVFDCIISMTEREDADHTKITNIFRSVVRVYHTGLKGMQQSVIQNLEFSNTSYLNNSIFSRNLNIFESCDITIDSAATLNSYKNNYHGFTNCRFKIGAETDYTALTGTTEAQLRNNFKSRCEAQGFAVPDVTDYNETLPMGRWVFADKCTFDGYILRGSIIDNFQTRRFILLGNTGKVVDTLPIGIGSEPFSFNPNSPKDNGIALNKNSIALSDDVLLDQISDNRISSSIGMLKEEGLAKLTLFDVVNNFDSSQGVRVAGDRAFGEPITKVDADTNYLIRSTDESEAIVTYNGVNYSSSLSTRNNIFRGVTDKSTFEKSANAVVYPVTDLAQQSIVEMRIVRELPPQIIKNGNLLADFWYFVVSDNVNNPTGTIRYKGVDYSFGSSFLVDADDLTFTIGNEVGNNLHLRRCWVENYDPNDKTYIDYAFWQGKQQPRWTKVISNDLRCLMTNDKMSSEIFAIDQQGEYITSGHPDFYTLINGDAGFSKQSFPIVGKFMQVRLNVSTYNAV